YLVTHEWVRSSQDILWRRSKLGLRISQAEAERIDRAIEALAERTVALA
ncbi:hypothetical protein ACELLULO517_08650, partial [Acidisoma cellulosilytica]|nr:hypothetical protein [Acidisoma cellulosilyticum]